VAAFRRLWVGESVSALGSGITDFALPLVAVITLHVTPGQMGLFRGLGSLPGIAIGLFAGVWIDRVSRRRLLLTLDLIAAALIVTVPLAAWLGTLTLVQLYALALAFGTLGPFWMPAWNAFVPSVVGPDLLIDANSKLAFSWASTGITGPAAGGVLVNLFSAPGALVADCASFLVSVGALATIRVEERPIRGEDRPPMLAQIREGLRVTFTDPMQRAITTPRAILDLIDATSSSIFVIYVIREVELDAAQLGLSLALSSIGFVLGSIFAPRIVKRLGIGGAIVLGLAMVGASPYTMILANRSHADVTNIAFLTLPGWIGGFGGIVQWIALATLRQQRTPDDLLGRVFASASVLGRILWVVGSIGGGFLAEAIGLRPVIVVCAIAYGIPLFFALSSPLRTARSQGEVAAPA
jgi:MFS family permease